MDPSLFIITTYTAADTVDFSQSMSMYQQQDAINFDASFQQSFTSKGGEYLETVSSSNTMFGFNNVCFRI